MNPARGSKGTTSFCINLRPGPDSESQAHADGPLAGDAAMAPGSESALSLTPWHSAHDREAGGPDMEPGGGPGPGVHSRSGWRAVTRTRTGSHWAVREDNGICNRARWN